jgi:4-amino-4-deoxy-L-arabinose transferase-like glycosyltransferase
VALEPIRWLDAGVILPALLALGLLVRAILAAVVMPLSGFAIDVGDFTAWGLRLASVGPGGFYQEGYFSDYPPGYLYVLWLLGSIGKTAGSFIGVDITRGLIKIPGILADAGVAWLLFVICRRWGDAILARVTTVARSAAARASAAPALARGETLGLVAAAVYLFNPGAIFDSAVWGQVDSVAALVALATIYALGRGWTEVAAVGAVVALLVKFQLGFLVPLVSVVGIKRHLFGRSADPLHHGRREGARVAWSLAAGLVTLLILLAPFGMTLYVPLAGGEERGLLGILPEADPSRSLIGKFVEAAGTYTGLSINAFNLWRLPFTGFAGGGDPGPLPGLGDTLQWGDDQLTLVALGGLNVSAQTLGVALFALAAALALWQVARRDDVRGILVATLLLAIAFFVLPTRVHERYLFTAVAIGAPLVLRSRGWALTYAGLSLVFFANVYWIYTEDWSHAAPPIMNPGPGIPAAPMVQDPVLSAALLTDAGIYLLVLLGMALLVGVAWRSLRLALGRVGTPAAITPIAAAAAIGQPSPANRGYEQWAERRAANADASGRFAWLRPDPADPYLREPTRRLDRLDAVILIGLVLGALLFRVWRLDVPRAMHFDEVYHGRSATEFLANWENGWRRDVYEWTHPMLAKYLIAAGIVIADPNKVIAETPTDGPAAALAVAPARSSVGRERSVGFSASGSELTARDVESGAVVARWNAGGPVASLAYDESSEQLLVGRADAGIVEAWQLEAFLRATGERAPPDVAQRWSTDTDSALDIVLAGETPTAILVRGAGGVAILEPTGEVRLAADGVYADIGWVSASGGEDGRAESVAVTDLARGSIVLLDPTTLAPRLDVGGGETDVFTPDAPPLGPLLVRGSGGDQQLFALTGPLPADPRGEHPATPGSFAVLELDDDRLIDGIPLPGEPSVIGWQPVANIVYMGGTAPDGSPVIWTVEPHGEARSGTNDGVLYQGTTGYGAFDETRLPGAPLAMAFDVSRLSQADDPGRLLVSASAPGGSSLVTVDASSNAFAWRLAGVTFGALLVGLVYLLAGTMFSRRRIAVLAGGFVALDGMSYVMSRISMNDIFVATFIVAAYLLFWQVWSGRWRCSAWWAVPLVGVLIGLAASTKWVGFYALAGLLVLVLARSSLGRLVLVALVAFGAVAAGLGSPWPFLVIVVGAAALALVIVYHRPIRVDADELRLGLPATGVVLGGIGLAFALAYSAVPGAKDPSGGVELLFAMLARGVEVGWPAWLMLGVALALIAWRAVASLRDPESDARWWKPSEMGGFAWSWVGACLIIVPLAVYLLSYVPYLALGHSVAITDTGPGYAWSLDELHRQMFGYHFGLTAGHDYASPWWSWPLDLKPVWFFGQSYDGRQMGVIYNGGNPILFWAGIPAIVLGGVLAWRRRSLALALLVAAFAFQFLPWARVERATFIYHYFTAVLFAMVAIAYLVDEGLRRWEWRDLAIGFLVLAAVAFVLVFPLGSALPVPDWYVTAARALPPWNGGFRFPDPPSGARGELLALSPMTLLLAVLVAAVAVAFAIWGRPWLERRRANGRLAEPAEG